LKLKLRLKKNCAGGKCSVSERAKEAGLYRLGHRPFNTVIKDMLFFRLVMPPNHQEKDLIKVVKDAFEVAAQLELIYPGRLPEYKHNPDLPNQQYLSWCRTIVDNTQQLSLEKYIHILSAQILPTMEETLLTLRRLNLFDKWIARYTPVAKEAFQKYQWVLEFNRYNDLTNLANEMAQVCPTLSSSPTITQKVIRILLGGGKDAAVDTELIGMRKEKYVNDLLDIQPLTIEEIEAVTPIIEAFAEKPKPGQYTEEQLKQQIELAKAKAEEKIKQDYDKEKNKLK